MPEKKKPSSRANPRLRLTRKELTKYEHALLDEKLRILRQGRATDEVMESSGTDATTGEPTRRTHAAEVGGENYQVEVASQLKEMEGRTLREIAEALERISNGKYGLCDHCGKPIPKARLEVVPHARLCMKCLRNP